jgi:hypothetical protein
LYDPDPGTFVPVSGTAGRDEAERALKDYYSPPLFLAVSTVGTNPILPCPVVEATASAIDGKALINLKGKVIFHQFHGYINTTKFPVRLDEAQVEVGPNGLPLVSSNFMAFNANLRAGQTLALVLPADPPVVFEAHPDVIKKRFAHICLPPGVRLGMFLTVRFYDSTPSPSPEQDNVPPQPQSSN